MAEEGRVKHVCGHALATTCVLFLAVRNQGISTSFYVRTFQLGGCTSSHAALLTLLCVSPLQMVARIQIDPTTWAPVGYRQPFCSDTEAWVFENWNNWTQAQQQQQRTAGGNSGSSGSSTHSIAE